MKNIAIIYHDADFDGKLSNEVCRYWLAKQHPEAHIHSYGWDYERPVPLPIVSQPPPDVGCQTTQNDGLLEWRFWDAIYIVDLSVDELMARPELRDKIVWIDHHKSAIEKWDNPQVFSVPFDGVKIDDSLLEAPAPFVGLRIDGVAACRLCWQWFARGEEGYADTQLSKTLFTDRLVDEPRLIRLAGEWDIWDKRDPDAEPLQYGLRSLESSTFQHLVDLEFKHGNPTASTSLLLGVLDMGRTIMSYCQKQADEHAIKHAHDVRFYGLTFCCLNIGGPGNSTLLRAAVKPHHDALMAWRFDGQKAYVSLYHAPGKEQHDLSKIAVDWKGGGHRGACGFRTELASLDSIFQGSYASKDGVYHNYSECDE